MKGRYSVGKDTINHQMIDYQLVMYIIDYQEVRGCQKEEDIYYIYIIGGQAPLIR